MISASRTKVERQRLTIVALLGVVSVLLIISLGVFWLARSSSIFANRKPGNSNGDAAASSQHQVAEPDQLPRHPFEHMGIAYLTPSTSMPDNAVTEAQAIDIVTEYIWGAYQDELVKNYPPSAVPAVYDAGESVMGPAAEKLPVRVVILEGWGPPALCAAPGPLV
jgi:hypothetical protein